MDTPNDTTPPRTNEGNSTARRDYTVLDTYGRGKLIVERRQNDRGEFFAAVRHSFSKQEKEWKQFDLFVGNAYAMNELGGAFDEARHHEIERERTQHLTDKDRADLEALRARQAASRSHTIDKG